MSEDDTLATDEPPESRVRRFIWRWFPWAYNRKTAVALALLMVATSLTTFAALGLWTGDIHLGPSFEDHPPGTNESGVTDGNLLVEQHALGLTEEDYRIRMNLSFEQGNETKQVRRTYEHDVDDDVLIGHVDAPDITYDVYNSPDQNATYYRATSANNTSVDYQRSERRETEFTARDFLKQRFRLFETESQGYTTLDDGTKVREFNIVGFNEKADDVLDTANYSVTGSFAITKKGVIREYNATIRTTEGNDTSVLQRESITIERETMHLTAPDWLDAALNETATSPAPSESGESQDSTNETSSE